MDLQNKEELSATLSEHAQRLTGSPMIKALVETCNEWLKENRVLFSGKSATENKSGNMKSRRRQERKAKDEETVEKETMNKKLPSMKTAEDVIHRILWDGDFQQDDFLVGYIDRFQGIQEKYFSAFSWEDISSVDYNVLAVPKHRIQYFKYKDVKVWDKSERVDNVFGSTGSNKKIADIVAEIQNNPKTQEVKIQQKANEEGSDDEYESDSDDSDDGITVTIQNPKNLDADENLDYAPDENNFWQDKMRPNYFLAVRIMDDDIKSAVDGIQDYITEHEPRYGPCCVPAAALHLTLCTVGLDTPEQVAFAVETLQKIKDELKDICPKSNFLTLKGVSHFFNRVIYAQVQCPPEFLELVDHLKICLKEAGVEIRDSHEFVPHMTIMKVTRPVSRIMNNRKIDPWLYSGFVDMSLGTQTVDGIYLCSMGDERRDDGFYVTPTNISL